MRNIKRLLPLLLVFALLLSAPATAADRTQLNQALEDSTAYMLKVSEHAQVGSMGGEWAVIGLARSGCDMPQEYWERYYASVEAYVREHQGILHQRKYTEYSRVILALTAIGANPTDVSGYNLLQPLGDFEKTIWQGINGPVWALIALDSGSYDIPQAPGAATQASRQLYIEEILSRQLDDGGWNLRSKGGSDAGDADITGMVLQALAPYRNQTAVKIAVEKALAFLSETQEASGGYCSGEADTVESVAQVVVALCTLGIDLDDARFVKNGNSTLDALLRYHRNDGSFRHTQADANSDQMATEQGFYALVAAARAVQGKNNLYQMSDTVTSVGGSAAVGLPGKHSDVSCVPVSAAGISFNDTIGHANQNAVEALASRGIINGFSSDVFGPDATMTRAQFAAVVVRALGLPMQTTEIFTDVRSSDWCAAYVGTAYAYGIVNGTTATTFSPNGTITRQQAAAMVSRAAKLCGMNTDVSDGAILNTLAQFGDYTAVGPWARESVAFCYREGILDQSDLNIEPQRAILRCEIAQIIYHLLNCANLL